MSTPSSASGSKPRALFLAAEAPYPTIGGGPIRAASVLEYLAGRFSVHAIFFREPGAPNPAAAIPAGKVDRVDVIDLPFHSKRPVARALRNISRLARNRAPLMERFSGFEAPIERCLAGQNYDAAFIEQFWCAPYVRQVRPQARRVFVDLYNVESAWHRSMASSESGLLRWSHGRFAEAALRLERSCLPLFDAVLTTSCSDAKLVRAISAGRVAVYPNTLPLVVPPPRSDRQEIVFSGNLEYAPNIGAVEFFYRKVWPALQSRWPKLKWKILGKNPGQFIHDLAARDSSIKVTGFVEDAVAMIAQSQVAIVPLLAGSGTRIKILEAWAAATPVVSTTLGAEGLEFNDREHLVLADNAESFTAAVSELLALTVNRERIGAAGRRLYEAHYTWQTAWKALAAVIDQ